jgi:DNA-binding response OmpR family regulator
VHLFLRDRSGVEGIEPDCAFAAVPELVLLDVGLPLLDGDGMLQGLADDELTPAIILMSADPRGPRIADDYPVAGYLPKPFYLDVALATIDANAG